MNDLDHRLTRIEERLAFTERTADELSGELRRAFEQIDRLARRLDGLVSQVRSAAADASEPEE